MSPAVSSQTDLSPGLHALCGKIRNPRLSPSGVTGGLDLPRTEGFLGSETCNSEKRAGILGKTPCSQRRGHAFDPWLGKILQAVLLLFSHSVVSYSLQPHGLQHSRLPCPSSFPGVAQIHAHWVNDAIQPSHPLSPPAPPILNISQHQGLFQ